MADGGVNPLTQERVVDAEVCHHALAVMTTAGLYETSGDWLYDIGLPGKSGIGGGIVTVSPGKGGLGTFAPPLDDAGNSVKGQLVAKFLSQRLGLDLFVSKPEPLSDAALACVDGQRRINKSSGGARHDNAIHVRSDVRRRSQESWVPMIAIALGQLIMSFNVASLPVAHGRDGRRASACRRRWWPPGSSRIRWLVAGFVMLGAKLAQRFGALRVFRAAVVLSAWRRC